MITSARIGALREIDDSYGWITALRAPAIRKLMADDGPLQLSLLDDQDLARSPPMTSRRAAGRCRNPVLAADRARKREDLLAATEKLLAPVIARVRAGRLRAQPRPGRRRQGDQQAQDRQALRRHHHRHQPDRHPQAGPDDAEAALDGFYVIRTPLPASQLDAPAVVTAYRTSSTSSGTSGTSSRRPGPAARLPTGWKNASKATCWSACSPPTSSGTCARPGRR